MIVGTRSKRYYECNCPERALEKHKDNQNKCSAEFK